MKFTVFLISFFIITSAQAQTARIVTDVGTIAVKLWSDNAPKTVENFVRLAKGQQKYIGTDGTKTDKPFYNGLIFHRVHPELGIFSGCPWGTGKGWPGYYMFDENPSDSVFDREGLVAMAKVVGDNRVGSQFFITTKAIPRLNGRYTIFGEVIGGMDVVSKISAVARDNMMQPKTPIRIKQVEIID